MTVLKTLAEHQPATTAPRIEVSLTNVVHEEDLPRISASSRRWIACGVFLVVLGVYVLTSPGRIDIVDGQARFDVAYNWIVTGRPIIRDVWISPFMSVAGQGGLRYSYYGAPASVFSIPLVWLGLHYYAPAIQPSQFLFSLTSSIFGAGIAPILFLFYLELGLAARKALVWTLVSSLATYLWPISNSTFDNAQHAFFTLAALYFGFLSARRRSVALAVVGGLMAGVLVLYQEYFLLLVPPLSISTLVWKSASSPLYRPLTGGRSFGSRLASSFRQCFDDAFGLVRMAWEGPGDARSSLIRYGAFLAAVGGGLLLSFGYNELRFGSWLADGKVRFAAQRQYPLFGNPLAGFLTLLVSPGKSMFLYSPALVLGILGIRKLWHHAPQLVAAVAIASLNLVLFISCISFAGGDWCWGPRYLAPLLPLWALAFPFALGPKVRREVVMAILGASFLVQALALSVENQRFFFARGLNDFFWAEDSWFYFKHSALLSRVSEVLSLNQGVPSSAQWFNAAPMPELVTYSIMGPPAGVPRTLAPIWMRHYKIFFLPRPWPLWMLRLRHSERPVNLSVWILGVLGLMALGGTAMFQGFQQRE